MVSREEYCFGLQGKSFILSSYVILSESKCVRHHTLANDISYQYLKHVDEYLQLENMR